MTTISHTTPPIDGWASGAALFIPGAAPPPSRLAGRCRCCGTEIIVPAGPPPERCLDCEAKNRVGAISA